MAFFGGMRPSAQRYQDVIDIFGWNGKSKILPVHNGKRCIWNKYSGLGPDNPSANLWSLQNHRKLVAKTSCPGHAWSNFPKNRTHEENSPSPHTKSHHKLPASQCPQHAMGGRKIHHPLSTTGSRWAHNCTRNCITKKACKGQRRSSKLTLQMGVFPKIMVPQNHPFFYGFPS